MIRCNSIPRVHEPKLEEFESARSRTPEQRLWMAVIGTAIDDAQSAIDSMVRLKKKGIVPNGTHWKLVEVLNHIKSEWFKTICQFVDTHPDWIFKLIEQRASVRGISIKEWR